jgi:hypothetical protein
MFSTLARPTRSNYMKETPTYRFPYLEPGDEKNAYFVIRDMLLAIEEEIKKTNSRVDNINVPEMEIPSLEEGRWLKGGGKGLIWEDVKAQDVVGLDEKIVQRVAAAAVEILATRMRVTDRPTFRILGSGKMEWGAGGADGPDVNLFRSGPGVLRTDAVIIAKEFQEI